MILRLGVIGAGFVGGAVINGFNTPKVKQRVVDPRYQLVLYSKWLRKAHT